MKAAYVDSSCLVAIATGEPGFRELMVRLGEVRSHRLSIKQKVEGAG